MRVIARGTLRNFWESPGREEAEEPLTAWYAHANAAMWGNWSDVKADYPSADWVGNSRVVFNIGGNKYRLVVKMEFAKQMIFIRFIGTHQEYDEIKDITTI
ncbi:MAG: type II toxin-antitoxin system HigB family toxin [Fimbriimonadaceae bacterium]|nr:type II toxin-antitoxin system HigB family toxin [Fimbriimonadaceae bacterium]